MYSTKHNDFSLDPLHATTTKTATQFKNNLLFQSLYFLFLHFVVLGIPLIYHHERICQ